MYTIETYSREYPDQVPGYYQWYKTYMEYQKVLNVMANMPKLWPTIKVSAHAIEGQYDQWCVDIFSEGVNEYGVKVIMRYDAIADANEFEKLLHYVNKISHGFLPPDKVGA